MAGFEACACNQFILFQLQIHTLLPALQKRSWALYIFFLCWHVLKLYQYRVLVSSFPQYPNPTGGFLAEYLHWDTSLWTAFAQHTRQEVLNKLLWNGSTATLHHPLNHGHTLSNIVWISPERGLFLNILRPTGWGCSLCLPFFYIH